jgi:integrase
MRRPTKHVGDSGAVSFRVRFRTDEGTETSLTFRALDDSQVGIREAKVDAERFAKMLDLLGPREALAWQRQNEEAPEERALGPTLDDWAEKFIDTRTGVTDGTRHNYRATYRLTYGHHLGTMRLGEITRDDVAKALNSLATSGRRDGEGYSDKSIANAHLLLASMFKEAVAESIITVSPTARIKLPRGTSHQRSEMLFLTAQEFATLVANTTAHYRPLVLTLGGTGMRWGEAEALDVRDVNLDAATVRINKAAKWDTSKSRRVVGPTKTKMSDRTVTLPAVLVETLRPLVEGRGRSARLFTATRGGPLRHKTFWSDVWLPACDAAGLSDPRPRIHDLRHSHASWLIEGGMSLVVIQRRLGHHSISVTADTYGHLSPDIQRAAAEAANLVLNEVSLLSLDT